MGLIGWRHLVRCTPVPIVVLTGTSGRRSTPVPALYRPGLTFSYASMVESDPQTNLPVVPPQNQRLHSLGSSSTPSNPLPSPLKFRLLTWNIDFSRPQPMKRLTTVLNYLESLLQHDPPTIILLQEVNEVCFSTLISHPFVQSHYSATDISPDSWIMGAEYGTVTLVPNSLSGAVKKVFRVPLPLTRMGRDALFVDLHVPSLTAVEDGEDKDPQKSSDIRVVRIASVHLESLDGPGDRARPIQLASVARCLTKNNSNTTIVAGIVAGDMNSISPVDKGLPERVELTDAWKVCKMGRTDSADHESWEDKKEDHTWGYQPRSRYKPSRLDKVLYVGAAKVSNIERVGIELRVSVKQNEGDSKLGVWASDHYGLLATFTINR